MAQWQRPLPLPALSPLTSLSSTRDPLLSFDGVTSFRDLPCVGGSGRMTVQVDTNKWYSLGINLPLPIVHPLDSSPNSWSLVIFFLTSWWTKGYDH